MKHIFLAVAIFYSLFTAAPCFAYEPGTHQVLSEQAARQSILGSKGGVLDDLGLKGLADPAQVFPDPQGGEWIYLGPGNTGKFIAATSADVLDLIKAGAALEDESPRSLFHFYDPVPGHLHPLNIKGISVPYSAPDWALGDSLLVVGQSYSLKDAREYFYQALTSAKESDRNQAFGKLFLSIGHVLHLVEEMAQPQHVRNDMHCDVDICKIALLQKIFGSNPPLYNPSLYESYTYEHVDATTYGGYPDVSLPAARSYWDNSDDSGLAQFTNENFVSAGTNFRMTSGGEILPDQEYANPVATSLSGSESIADVYQELGQQVPEQISHYCDSIQSPCGVQFAATQVVDSYTGISEINGRASSYSIFDQYLEKYGSQKLFSLNVLNFQYDWKYLLPRAIGYSTGLINYFFRGRLDVQPDPNNPSSYLVINKSSYPMSNGTLTLYYDDANGNRYPVPGASWANVSMAATGNNPADQYSIQFSPPTSPAAANPGQYMLVFQGKIGTEAGIAGKLFGIAPHYLYTFTHQLCCSIQDCVTVSAFTDDFNFGSLRTIDTQVSSGGGFYPIIMAIYNGIDYVINSQFELYPPSFGFPPGWGCGSTLAKIQNLTILEFPCTSDTVTTLDGIAVNTNYIYVSGTERPGYIGNIFIFDHSGKPVKTLVNMPAAGLNHTICK